MVDREIIDDLAGDINSWGNLYIITDGECKDLAEGVHEKLEMQGISTFVIADDAEVDLNGDDVVLAISKTGREDYIRSMVKNALRNKIKAYGICRDFRSPMAMLCDEAIIIHETDDFDVELLGIFDAILENLSTEAEDDSYDIQDPALPGIISSNVSSRMNGVIISVNVNVGDVVREGDVLFVMEAMKMENEICADFDGVVEKIMIKPGDFVSLDDSIMEIRERS